MAKRCPEIKSQTAKCPKRDFQATFVQNGALQTEFPFTARIPQIGTKVPQMDKVKRPQLCALGDLPKCWRVCRDLTNALFLILQEDQSLLGVEVWAGAGKGREGVLKAKKKKNKPRQLLGQSPPCSPPQFWSSAAMTAGRVRWGTALQQRVPGDLASEKSPNRPLS